MVARGLHYLHHGDDFAIVGTRSEVKWISEQIGQHFIDKKVMTILHRVLRWVKKTVTTDQRENRV